MITDARLIKETNKPHIERRNIGRLISAFLILAPFIIIKTGENTATANLVLTVGNHTALNGKKYKLKSIATTIATRICFIDTLFLHSYYLIPSHKSIAAPIATSIL